MTSPSLDQKALAAAQPWPLFGYAPGDYMCHCALCSKEFIGDKRAVMCLECAASAANRQIADQRAAELTAASLPALEPVAVRWQKYMAVWQKDHTNVPDMGLPASEFADYREGGGGTLAPMQKCIRLDCDCFDVWHCSRPAIGASPPSHQGLREALAALADQAEHVAIGVGIGKVDVTGAVVELMNCVDRARAALQSQPAPSGETK